MSEPSQGRGQPPSFAGSRVAATPNEYHAILARKPCRRNTATLVTAERASSSIGEGEAKAADRAVHTVLAENHRGFLRMLIRRLGSREDAEDALQEVWLKVASSNATLDRGTNVQAWLRRVLRNVVVDQYRRRAARHRAENALQLEPAAMPGDLDEAHEVAVCVCLYGLLPTLKPQYAELLWRVDLAGQPREAVAQDLVLTPNNLAVRLHRARQALGKRLQKTCETCPTHGFRSCACPKGARRPAASERTVRAEDEARLTAKVQAGATGAGSLTSDDPPA